MSIQPSALSDASHTALMMDASRHSHMPVGGSAGHSSPSSHTEGRSRWGTPLLRRSSLVSHAVGAHNTFMAPNVAAGIATMYFSNMAELPPQVSIGFLSFTAL